MNNSLSILTRKQIETALEVFDQYENIHKDQMLKLLATRARDTSQQFRAYYAAHNICARLERGE